MAMAPYTKAKKGAVLLCPLAHTFSLRYVSTVFLVTATTALHYAITTHTFS